MGKLTGEITQRELDKIREGRPPALLMKLITSYEMRVTACEVLEAERDMGNAFKLEVARAVGIVHQAEGHEDQPGPDERILEEVRSNKRRLEEKADRQIVVLRLENWQGAIGALNHAHQVEDPSALIDRAIMLLTKVDDGHDEKRMLTARHLASMGTTDPYDAPETEADANALLAVPGYSPTEPSYDTNDRKLELRDGERAAYEAVRVASRVTFNEAMLAGAVARVFGLEYERPVEDTEPEQTRQRRGAAFERGLRELAAEWRASGEGRRDAHAEQEGQVYLQCAQELETLVAAVVG